MHITKTDYLEYTFCKKNLWLKKHKPELFDGVELSEFEKKIIEEGNDADEAYSLTAAAQDALGNDRPIQGPLFWEFEGETLVERRKRMEEE